MNMHLKPFASIAISFALLLILSACGKKEETVKLQGAGASFPAPLYNKWFKSYGDAHQNVHVDYQSVGSGSGVKSFMDRTVDFGASDAAMKPEDMAKVEGGVQLLPMTAGSIVLAYNLKDVAGLKLSREALHRHFSRQGYQAGTTRHSQRKSGCEAAGPAINVVVRADSSGTSFVFYQALERGQPGFRQERRRQHHAELAGRHQVQGQRGHHREHADDAGIDRLHRIRLR